MEYSGKRQLGWKNYRLFALLVLIVVTVGALFVGSIVLMNQSAEAYDVVAGSSTLDKDYNLISIKNSGKITRGFNGNFALSTTNDKSEEVKYDLGKNAVVYSDGSYKFYLYGQAYLINNDTSVKKSDKMEEISKSKPAFYKLDDRKYLIADKTIKSKEISLDTTGYLIVELDRQGNATLVNHKINMRTINPIIIKGTYYDFDVVHEKLIVDDEEIDLTNIIGSTNEHEDPEIVEETDEEGGDGQVSDKTDVLKGYYDKYFEKIRKSFNNLYSGANKTNSTLDSVARKTNVALDLTRWTNVTGLSTAPSSITVNYQVFDPNNEYSQIFVAISEYGSENETRYSVSKEYTSYMIRDLLPDHKYNIRYGYVLAKVVDESQADVYVDNLVVVTPKPKTEVSINKITTNRVHFVLKLDKEYEISQAKIHFIVDGAELGNMNYNLSQAVDFAYEDSFAYSTLGRVVEIRVTDMMYNGIALSDVISGVYINE